MKEQATNAKRDFGVEDFVFRERDMHHENLYRYFGGRKSQSSQKITHRQQLEIELAETKLRFKDDHLFP
jgi:hypothetical protein